jgi:hypothetical protein
VKLLGRQSDSAAHLAVSSFELSASDSAGQTDRVANLEKGSSDFGDF